MKEVLHFRLGVSLVSNLLSLILSLVREGGVESVSSIMRSSSSSIGVICFPCVRSIFPDAILVGGFMDELGGPLSSGFSMPLTRRLNDVLEVCLLFLQGESWL